MLDRLRHLFDHLYWADERLAAALVAGADRLAPEAYHELFHVLGAEEVWLARLEAREPRAQVWPARMTQELDALLREVHAGYRSFLEALDAAGLARRVDYTNSAGGRFTNTVEEILFHVAMHGQYHRGKVNVMLYQGGLSPAPVDYIAFLRGAPAATRADARRFRQQRPTEKKR